MRPSDATRELLLRAFAGQAEVLGRLGVGGQAEVWRLRDLWLDRPMVVKLPREAGPDPVVWARLENERRVVARLEHPAVPPVYGCGVLEDGRPWFTMRELSHQPLSALAVGPPPDSAELERRVAWVARAAEAAGHAHGRGLVHRDLKPDNLVLDAVAGVQVIDWGLAGPAGTGLADAPALGAPLPGQTEVAGTPAFMAPEQLARGLRGAGPSADVFSLGVTLHVLVTGQMPFRAWTVEARIDEIARGWTGAVEPRSLREIMRQALAARPEDRFPDAAELAEALHGWLERARRLASADALVERASSRLLESRALASQVHRLREQSRQALLDLPVGAPEALKHAAWSMAEEAQALEIRRSGLEDEALAILGGAREHLPGYEPARTLQADIWKERLARAEAAGQVEGLEAMARLVARHGGPSHRDWLRADGAITLLTDPPGAEVRLLRFGLRRRRLVAEPMDELRLGPTPLVEVALPRGSYLLLVSAPGREEVRYPVAIGRAERWHGRPPESDAPEPVWLPPRGTVGPSEVYVPAGWFRYGDERAHSAFAPGRAWIPGFVAMRDPVSLAEYLVWLDALWAAGATTEAARRAPALVDGRALVAQGPDGFAPVALAEGKVAALDAPVTGISGDDLAAYAAWRAARDGQPWRLPRELEWEKLARGVDGRAYPWGDAAEPSFANVRASEDGHTLPDLLPVERYPVATSVYGARGVAGHVFQWCDDGSGRGAPVTPSGALLGAQPGAFVNDRTWRGGSYSRPVEHAHCAARLAWGVHRKSAAAGGRLVRSLLAIPGRDCS